MSKYIDADKLIEELEAGSMPIYQANISGILGDKDCIKDYIKRTPAADVQQVKHGRWLQLSDDDQYEGSYLCSECRTEETFFDESSFSNYCPNCGAKMDGKDGKSSE